MPPYRIMHPSSPLGPSIYGRRGSSEEKSDRCIVGVPVPLCLENKKADCILNVQFKVSLIIARTLWCVAFNICGVPKLLGYSSG